MNGRVVHVCKVSGLAGAENHLLSLLPGLAARRFDVHALVLGSEAETRRFRTALSAAGVANDRVPIRAPLDPLAVSHLARHLRRLRPALVHTHLIHADLHGQAAARRAGVAYGISSRHNTDPFRRWGVVRLLDAGVLRRVDRVIAISDAVARFVVEVEGADPHKVRAVPYGLDAAPPPREGRVAGVESFALGGPLVGCVGRATRQKGIDVLIDAFPLVLSNHPTARLIIVGDGPLRRTLERRARRQGLGDAVVFAGWIDAAAELMAGCDLVAIPSRWEGFGMVALEAMAVARPIVASDVDALAEIVSHQSTGLLVPAGDPASLAAAVSRLLADPGLAATLGAAGLRRLQQRYPVARMVDGTAAVYEELLGGEPTLA